MCALNPIGAYSVPLTCQVINCMIELPLRSSIYCSTDKPLGPMTHCCTGPCLYRSNVTAPKNWGLLD
eukprot:SAG31_NODE_10845_length_1091_cov_1.750000_1_plen_66_part_10